MPKCSTSCLDMESTSKGTTGDDALCKRHRKQIIRNMNIQKGLGTNPWPDVMPKCFNRDLFRHSVPAFCVTEETIHTRNLTCARPLQPGVYCVQKHSQERRAVAAVLQRIVEPGSAGRLCHKISTFCRYVSPVMRYAASDRRYPN